MERKTDPKPKAGFERHLHETKPVKIDPLAETGKYAALTPAEIALRTQEPKSAEKTLILQQAEEQRRQEEEARRIAELERIKAGLIEEARRDEQEQKQAPAAEAPPEPTAAPQSKILKRPNHTEPKANKPGRLARWFGKG